MSQNARRHGVAPTHTHHAETNQAPHKTTASYVLGMTTHRVPSLQRNVVPKLSQSYWIGFVRDLFIDGVCACVALLTHPKESKYPGGAGGPSDMERGPRASAG